VTANGCCQESLFSERGSKYGKKLLACSETAMKSTFLPENSEDSLNPESSAFLLDGFFAEEYEKQRFEQTEPSLAQAQIKLIGRKSRLQSACGSNSKATRGRSHLRIGRKLIAPSVAAVA